jgi:hypothetical protein
MSQSNVNYRSSVLLILCSCVHVTGQEACAKSIFWDFLHPVPQNSQKNMNIQVFEGKHY